MLTAREELLELDSLIAAHKANLAHTRTLLNNPELAQRLVAERRETIAKLIEQIAEIESVQLHGPEMIERAKARIAELTGKRSHVKNAEAIEKMLQLAADINDIQKGAYADDFGMQIEAEADSDEDLDAPDAEDLQSIEDIVEGLDA